MRKLLLFLFLLLSLTASPQISSHYETVDTRTINTVGSGECSIRFTIDTVSRILVVKDQATGCSKTIFLRKLSPIIFRAGQFVTWGYDRVKGPKNIRSVSFTEYLNGNLASVNMYTDSVVTMFYITEQLQAYKYLDNPPFYEFPIVDSYTNIHNILHVYYASSPFINWSTLSLGLSYKNFLFWYNHIPPDEFTPKFELSYSKIIW